MHSASDRFCLVATARNEAPYLLEWVAWHRLIGFDEIIVFQNDSDDLTHEILTEMQRLGLLVYRYNKAGPGQHQVKAYRRAARQPEYLSCDWAMALDLDEMLCLNGGLNTLRDWLALLPEGADRIFVNWRQFGSSGHVLPVWGLVSESFTQCEKPSDGLRVFKTLFRRARFERPGIHQPRGNDPSLPEPVSINASGLGASEFTQRNFQCTDPALCRHAQINHYITRDAGSFVLKAARGSAHQANREIGLKYWVLRGRNELRDDRMAAQAERIRAQMEAYDQMSGGRLMKMREAAIRRHRERLFDVLKDPEMTGFYENLTDPEKSAQLQRQYLRRTQALSL